MPPEEKDENKEQGVWGKYRNWILIGGAIVIIAIIGMAVHFAGPSEASGITLTSLSNQLQNVQATLINQATAISHIPTDSPSYADIQESVDAILLAVGQLTSINDQLVSLGSQYLSLSERASATYDLALSLNATLTRICEALNITEGIP